MLFAFVVWHPIFRKPDLQATKYSGHLLKVAGRKIMRPHPANNSIGCVLWPFCF
jgi:hypothetical protein